MGKAGSFKVGDPIYVYFGGKFRKQLRKCYRKKDYYFFQFIVVEVDDKRITAIYNEQVCDRKHPFSGHGVTLDADSDYIFSEKTFFSLRYATDTDIEKLCENCGYKTKEFKKAFKPFRAKDKRSAEIAI